jgi:hypothetical protein
MDDTAVAHLLVVQQVLQTLEIGNLLLLVVAAVLLEFGTKEGCSRWKTKRMTKRPTSRAVRNSNIRCPDPAGHSSLGATSRDSRSCLQELGLLVPLSGH